MQEHQLAGEAGRRVPSWYLARGDKRYGPLADRELLLLAERGGLHTDDLLWKPGFTSWKSVHAVCGVKPSHTTPMPSGVLPQDAEYLPTREASSGQAEIGEAADVSETAKEDFDAECILQERELAPDGKLARAIYNNAAWTLAFSLGTFIVALGIFWLIATGYRLP